MLSNVQPAAYFSRYAPYPARLMQDLTKEAALPSVEASPTVREIRALEARLRDGSLATASGAGQAAL